MVVVGGGIAGAVAAFNLSLEGAQVVLLEADRLGCGATGRSGGYVVPSFPILSPRAVIRQLGDEGEKLTAAVAGSADYLFQVVEEHRIACDAGQNGWFQPTFSSQKLDILKSDTKIWKRFGLEATVCDERETQRRTGVPGYRGSLFMAAGGTIHPVKLIHGLMQIAVKHGARYRTKCPAVSLERLKGRWHVRTPDGVISAENVLICTNGQSPELLPAMNRALIPVAICHTASKPVAESKRPHLFGQGTCLSDTRVNLFTYRFDADWRLISGGLPSLIIGSGERIGMHIAERLSSNLAIERGVHQEYLWFGHASITQDNLPKATEIGPGAYSFTACNGRGLALSAVFAERFARAILSGKFDELPISLSAPKPFRRRSLTRIATRLYPIYGSLKDRLTK